jgi:hypothetical protein
MAGHQVRERVQQQRSYTLTPRVQVVLVAEEQLQMMLVPECPLLVQQVLLVQRGRGRQVILGVLVQLLRMQQLVVVPLLEPGSSIPAAS